MPRILLVYKIRTICEIPFFDPLNTVHVDIKTSTVSAILSLGLDIKVRYSGDLNNGLDWWYLPVINFWEYSGLKLTKICCHFSPIADFDLKIAWRLRFQGRNSPKFKFTFQMKNSIKETKVKSGESRLSVSILVNFSPDPWKESSLRELPKFF